MQNKGHIEASDIHRMMNQMGLKVNIDEAQVLLISADSNQDNMLSLNEFIDLIFSTNDALNVDLTHLLSNQANYETVIAAEQAAATQQIDNIRKDVEWLREMRAVN